MEVDCVLRERLDSAAHFTSLAEYLRLFTHEINNPLAVVYGEAYQLRERSRKGPLEAAEIEHTAEALERMALRMMDLIQDLRLVLKLSVQEVPEVLAGKELLDLALKYTRRDLEASDIEVLIESSGISTCVRGRRMQLARALWNLIGNAGESLARRPTGRRLRIRAENQGSAFVLHITDNGPGVTPSVRQQMFEPFVSTKSGGAGLGLFAAKLWLEQNLGSLAWSEAAGETTFTVSLPSA